MANKAPVRVAVRPERCIGSGRCAQEVPDVFDQREEDGIVRLVQTRLSVGDDGLRARVLEAARMCPARAITVEEVAD